MNKEVTVFMPVYNGEKYLNEAIDSVLNQTFKNFKLLIINDGSTDSSEQIIQSYTDERIQYVKNEKNLGLFGTRNRALEFVDTEFFSILDCDDVAYLDRLEVQYNFMKQNPDVYVCGGSGVIINEHSEVTENMKRDSGLLNLKLLFSNQLINSTLFLRSELFKNYRYEDYPPAEDYEFAFRISQKYKIYNLPNVFVKYRIHGQNITNQKRDVLIYNEKRIAKNILDFLKVETTERNILYLHSLIAPYHGQFSILKWTPFLR